VITMNSNAAPSSLPSTVSSVVYVRQGGSDTAGDGTLSKPYATIQQALTSITDNTATKVYEVNVGPGIFSTPFQIKPFTSVVGTDSGSNFFGQTQITAGANTCGFDASWGASGFAYAWFAALVFTNGQTYTQPVGSQPQLNYRSCTFQGLMQYTGPGTSGVDNLLWEGCLAYGGVTVEGWQFFWTRHTEMLGGTVTIQTAANAGATESTTWLAKDTGIGRPTDPTAVVFRWAAPTPIGFSAIGSFINSAIVGSLTLDGVHTSFFGTPEAMPQTLTLMNGATVAGISLNYAPAVLANWSGNAPYSLPNALDRIGAQLGQIPLAAAAPAAAAGANAGAGASVVVAAGSDQFAGRLDLTTGAGPSAGDYVDITFATPFPATPKSAIVGGANANVPNGILPYVSALSATGFTISTPEIGAAATLYQFYYIVAP
jgi:hypothetical protein